MATRKTKKTTDTPREAVLTVPLPGGVEFGCSKPTQEIWDDYLMHLIQGHESIAQRELVQRTVCTHSIPEAKEIIARFPGMPKKFCDKVDDLIGGDLVPEVDQEKGLVLFELDGQPFSMVPPDQEKWDRSQEPKPGQKFGPVMRDFLSDLVDNKAQFLAALEKFPAAIGPLVKATGEIAGSEFEVTVKKE